MRKLLLFIPALFFACEEVINIEREDADTTIVLNGIFNSDSTFRVSLYQSRDILDNRFPQTLEGADVTLFEDDRLIGSLISKSYTDDFGSIKNGGLYEIDYHAKPGHTYKVEAAKDGFKSVFAADKIPDSASSFLGTQLNTQISNNVLNADISLDLSDGAGTDFYELKIYYSYMRPRLQDGEVKEVYRAIEPMAMESDDVVFEEHLIDHMVFTDGVFQGGSKQISVEATAYINSYFEEEYGIAPEAKIIVELREVSSSYYRYYNTVSLQQWLEGDPFAEPVQVFNNINNGFGILAGYSSQHVEIDV